MHPSCPAEVIEIVGPGGWEALPPSGAVPGRTPVRWRVGPHLVVDAGDRATATAEAVRVTWLAERVDWGAGPVAGTVVAVSGRWLVLDGPVGEPADRPEWQPEPDRVPEAVGRALRRLHDLDPADCPFTRSPGDELVALARAAAEERIDRSLLPAPYDRYRPAELVELAAMSPGGDRSDDLVVGHGRALVGHVLLADGLPSGLLGLDRFGPVERHRDLAVTHRHLQALFGPEAVPGLYDGYGTDPDLVLLDRAVLMDVLDQAVSGPRPVEVHR